MTGCPAWSHCLLLTPRGRDAQIAQAILDEAGFAAKPCASLDDLVRELEQGAGLAVIANETLRGADPRALVAWLQKQPPWSDFPIVLLVGHGAGPERNPDVTHFAELLGNVTFLERPFRPTTLVSVVRTALRSRTRQYQMRDNLDQLARSEQQLQTALGAAELGAWHYESASGDFRMSAQFCAIFGRDPAKPFGLGDLLGALHPDDVDHAHGSVVRLLETGGVCRIEFRAHWPDGSLHWFETHARALRDATGTIEGLTGVSSNITARKNAELEREQLLQDLASERAALGELTKELERRVAERTEAMRRANEKREQAQEQLRQAQKMETIGQLTGGVAHDFNNLLMAVQGNLELLRKRVGTDERAVRYVDGALQGVARGTSLTQRLLAFARRQKLQSVPVDLKELLLGMRDLLTRSLGPRIQLELDLPPNLPAVQIDQNQVELAILNLAVNARDAMPEGGTISISITAPRTAQPRSLTLCVADTGTGMDAETLRKAVEPFFSTKPTGKGTGLGLSMVHGLAKQLGGAFELQSAPGRGTRALLRLPVAAQGRRAVRKEAGAPPLPASSRAAHILLVDDDTLIAQSTAAMLEDLGHRVTLVDSAPSALELLREEARYDLLITDHLMPGMTGTELVLETRRLGAKLPVLITSGYAELSEGTLPDVPRLNKPYQQEQLRVRVQQLLA